MLEALRVQPHHETWPLFLNPLWIISKVNFKIVSYYRVSIYFSIIFQKPYFRKYRFLSYHIPSSTISEINYRFWNKEHDFFLFLLGCDRSVCCVIPYYSHLSFLLYNQLLPFLISLAILISSAVGPLHILFSSFKCSLNSSKWQTLLRPTVIECYITNLL